MAEKTVQLISVFTNLGMFAVSLLVISFAVYSFRKTLKESWKDRVTIAASEYLGECEKFRLRQSESKNLGTNTHLTIDSNLSGKIVSLQKRLEMLFPRENKYKNILNMAEQLRNMADNGKSFKIYVEVEGSFIKMISSI